MTKIQILLAGVATVALGMPVYAAEPTNADLLRRIEALEAELQASEMRQAKDHDQVQLEAEPAWFDNTTISGRMYFDITHIDHEKDGSKSGLTDNGTSFDIKRFYVGIDHKFDDVFSANVTTDFQYDSNSGATQVYIKKAYLQAKISDALVVRLGSADLPWIPFVEDLYGYRYIENTVADRTKFGTSADWGVHLSGSGKFSDATLSYAVAIVNGAGYKKANVFRTEQPDVEGRISLKWSDFTFGIGGYYGKLGQQYGANTFHTASRFNAVAAYTTDTVRLGVEYFHADNWNNVTKTLGDSSDGVSVFGSYKFDPEWSVFGRYDWVKPNQDTNDDLDENYFNVGIAYSPVKIVDLALVYKHDKAEDGLISTSNGSIGGVDDGTYDEVGLFGQLRW